MDYKTSDMRFAHSKVPSDLASYANIPQEEGDLASVIRASGGVYFEEFSQAESIVTRISSTINESTTWASLNEFVANAEDCGSANQAKWILDSGENKFPARFLFCPELKEWQTPALYFYNNGLFTDSDFEALIKIGMGSDKKKDSSKIGKYGYGALTMYQLTDVPSLISGELLYHIRSYSTVSSSQEKGSAPRGVEGANISNAWKISRSSCALHWN